MDNIQKCILCGETLNATLVRGGRKKCYDCVDQTHLNIIMSPVKLANTFSKQWASSLLAKYFRYLKETGIRISAIRKNVDKAKKILLLAESDYLSPYEITVDWVEKKCEKGPKGLKSVKISLLCFLEEQEILKMPDENDLLQARILNMNSECG
ncbi:MAG: hypothetical protein ACYC2T_15990 [Bacillota bacterium]